MTNLSIIIPTYNESKNILKIYKSLDDLNLKDVEFVFVDDLSPDHTFDIITDLSRKDPRVRLIVRPNRRGLSSAIFEGMFSCISPYIIVIDADLQHDETIIPHIYQELSEGGASIVVASRKLSERLNGQGFENHNRSKLSYFGMLLANLVLPAKITDPMSGFFGIRRNLLFMGEININPVGYKALIDIILMSRNPIIKEVFYEFKERVEGESKLNPKVMWDFTCQILSYLMKGILPPQFISFILVGSIGLLLHILVYASATYLSGSFKFSHILAVLTATLFNFFINNILTFSLHKLTGLKLVKGLLIYLFASSLGLFLNIGAAILVHEKLHFNGLVATLAGVLIDVVWKYTISSHIVWKST